MKGIAGVTQTHSHCGCRDQDPRSNYVLNVAAYVNCERVTDIYHGSERKTGHGKLGKECIRAPLRDC